MYTHINTTMYPVGSNYVTHSLPAHRPKTVPLLLVQILQTVILETWDASAYTLKLVNVLLQEHEYTLGIPCMSIDALSTVCRSILSMCSQTCCSKHCVHVYYSCTECHQLQMVDNTDTSKKVKMQKFSGVAILGQPG